MVNNHDKLSKQNIIILVIGLAIFAISFLFIAMVGQHPEGFMGFLAPFSTKIYPKICNNFNAKNLNRHLKNTK